MSEHDVTKQQVDHFQVRLAERLLEAPNLDEEFSDALEDVADRNLDPVFCNCTDTKHERWPRTQAKDILTAAASSYPFGRPDPNRDEKNVKERVIGSENVGYEIVGIIEAEYPLSGFDRFIVLGHKEREEGVPDKWVTWSYVDGAFAHGHYFTDKGEAREDFLDRAQ